MRCKVTNKIIEPFMSFGEMPLANGFLKKEDFDKEFFFNLEVGFSEELSLFQLNEFPNPTKMFNENYPFFSGSSEYMKKHFFNYFNWIKKNYLNDKSNIIEIGSNDGTMLINFKNEGFDYIGFEPSMSVAKKAKENNINTLVEFFCYKNVSLLSEFKHNTDVICAANVVCHVPDITDLIKSVDLMLTSKGVFIFEEPYLGSMFDKVSYDQIYDEHIYMFSASSVQKIFNRFDMELINALPQETHGGSMRYVIARKNQRDINGNLKNIIKYEKNKGIDNISSCLEFKKNCELSKKKVVDLLNMYKKQNKKICGYAATSKSTTILNYCQIGPNSINCIYDTTKEKIGKFSPGMHIPIIPTENFTKDKPDVSYLFAWNHKEEIFNKEKNFLSQGGTWISHVNI
jgi:methylation protein EvaC